MSTHGRFSRSGAVSAVAWGYIAASLLVAALLLPILLGGEAVPLLEHGSGGLSDGVAWLLARSRLLAGLLLGGALLTLLLAVALLCRRHWARLAFTALMAAGFVAVLGGAALTPLTFGLLPEAATHGTLTPEEPMAGLVGILGRLVLLGTVLAALFAWTGWLLTTPEVRAEFEGGAVRHG